MSWYKCWQESDDGPQLVMRIPEEETAKDVDVSMPSELSDWLIFREAKEGVEFAYRIFFSENVHEKLMAEGGAPMSDSDFNRWQHGQRMEV